MLIILLLATLLSLVTSNDTPVNTTSKTLTPQLSSAKNISGPVITLNDYPRDPFQLRVPDTTTTLIFGKYGPPIHFETFLNLISKAQYQTVQDVIAARGDGPVSRSKFKWTEKIHHVTISRPLAQEDLTWLMLADALEGLRLFFDGLQGWFETKFTILDDTAGIVGSGSVDFW